MSSYRLSVTSEDQDEGTETEPSEEGPDSESSPDLNEHPVGASAEMREVVAEGLEEELERGALSEVLSNYSAEEFNELVGKVSDKYIDAQKRKFRYNIGLVIISVVFTLLLFGGLAYVVLTTGENGAALIFFAGTLAGYFMRLASDKF